MKNRKILLFILCFLVMTMLFAACGGQTNPQSNSNTQTTSSSSKQGGSDNQEEILVGYAVMRMVDPFWANQIKGMKKAIADSGKNIKLQIADNNNDGQTTLQNCESLIAQGAKLLIVSTPDPKVGTSIMEKANAAKIPVIACDVPIEGAYFSTYDNKKAGSVAGEFAAKYFNEKFSGKKAKIAILTHAAVASVVDDRIAGFKEAFSAGFKNVEYLPAQDTEGLREKGASVMADIITANPDVNGMFGVNDDIALGAAAAVEQRGLNDKIACFGQGGTDDSVFNALLNPQSALKATTAFDPVGHGVSAIKDMAIPLLDGKQIDKTVYTPLTVATGENASQFLSKK